MVANDGSKRFQINAQNCVHCKTCDIKDPAQNITWVARRRYRRAELPQHVRQTKRLPRGLFSCCACRGPAAGR
ncbi:4Fe-4S dicluster domain-containing protein [Pseudomonas aeruginosa]|nr:4Fe-4S dicluster domain-containing protein [Pseudomonas aeruginosa]